MKENSNKNESNVPIKTKNSEERQGIVKGNFLELSKIDSGMIIPYYVCRKCDKNAGTKHENPECHSCANWGGCSGDCTLSHLVCKDCNIIQKI